MVEVSAHVLIRSIGIVVVVLTSRFLVGGGRIAVVLMMAVWMGGVAGRKALHVRMRDVEVFALFRGGSLYEDLPLVVFFHLLTMVK